MSEESLDDRLSRISTDWGALRDAHAGAGQVRSAQEIVILRYGPAIRRYLKRVAGDAEAADELFQEFGVALVEGKLASADPDRGRFRDYVKAVLRNLVAKHYARRKKLPQQLVADSPVLGAIPAPAPEEDKFDEAWRENLLARAWAALAEANATAYEALRFRAEHPALTSQEMATRLGAKLGQTLTPESVRQTIHRARKQFALLLVTKVGETLASPTTETVTQELAELGLLEYCRPALEG